MAAAPHKGNGEISSPEPRQQRRRKICVASGWCCVFWVSAIAAAPPPEGCDNLNGMPIYQRVLWDEVWTALDEQASCTQNCHVGSQPSGDLDLSSREFSIYFLVGQPSSQDNTITLVEPGDPKRSLLLRKVNCDQPSVGDRMPLGDAHIPIELQGLIYDWIKQGAFGESPEDPIERQFVFADSWESIRCRASPDGSDQRCPVDNDFWDGGRK